jgi:hypothetical protein
MRRVELGGCSGADALEHASAGREHGLGGLQRSPRDLRAQLDERALERAHQRDEAEATLDTARHLALEDKG